MFIIAHRLSTVKDCDRIIVLEKGNIIEDGNHNALIEAKGYYYKLYQYQAK
jgi:ABC-type multidrug transport system fused ATPase/permease subunit